MFTDRGVKVVTDAGTGRLKVQLTIPVLDVQIAQLRFVVPVGKELRSAQCRWKGYRWRTSRSEVENGPQSRVGHAQAEVSHPTILDERVCRAARAHTTFRVPLNQSSWALPQHPQ